MAKSYTGGTRFRHHYRLRVLLAPAGVQKRVSSHTLRIGATTTWCTTDGMGVSVQVRMVLGQRRCQRVADTYVRPTNQLAPLYNLGTSTLCKDKLALTTHRLKPYCAERPLVVYGPRCRGGTTAPPIKTTAQGKDLGGGDGNLNTIDNHGAPLSER
jgi:hypothetical protein